MTNKKPVAEVATDSEDTSVYPDVYAETPSAGDLLEEALQKNLLTDNDTINYSITIGKKVLKLKNVPVKDNSTNLQAQIIAIYGGLGAGKHKLEGTDITVTITEED